MGVRIKVNYESEADFITEGVHLKLRKGRGEDGGFYIRRDYLNKETGHDEAILFKVDEETYRRIILDDEERWI